MPAMNIGPGALGGLEDKSPEIIANGTGVDDRLTTFNRAQSLRDYFPAGVTGRGVVALALLGAFLLWCVRAFPTVLATAWNFFRPLNPPRPPPSSRT